MLCCWCSAKHVDLLLPESFLQTPVQPRLILEDLYLEQRNGRKKRKLISTLIDGWIEWHFQSEQEKKYETYEKEWICLRRRLATRTHNIYVYIIEWMMRREIKSDSMRPMSGYVYAGRMIKDRRKLLCLCQSLSEFIRLIRSLSFSATVTEGVIEWWMYTHGEADHTQHEQIMDLFYCSLTNNTFSFSPLQTSQIPM